MKSSSTDTAASITAGITEADIAAPVKVQPAGESGDALRKVTRWVVPLVVVAALIALWQLLVVAFHVKYYFIPSPVDVASSIDHNFRYLCDNCVPTIGQAAFGFVVGTTAGILMAIWFTHFAAARRAFYPLAVILQSIPLVAMAPILIVALGTGLSPKVTMVAIITFFPTLVNMMRGLTSVDPNMLQLFQSVHASRWKVLTKLRWPSAMPYLFVALRITASSAILGATLVEWIGSNTGLGYLMINATYQFNTPFLWATVFVSTVLVLLAIGAVSLLERLLVPWEKTRNADLP